MKAIITVNGKSVEIELSTEQAESLGIKDDKKTGWERVCVRDGYFAVNSYTKISLITERNDSLDKKQYDSGNYFSDESLAEKMAKRISLMLRMQRWADGHNGEIDWSNKDQRKYFVYYNEVDSHLGIVDSHKTVNVFGCVWFSSRELAEQAIEIFGEEIKETYID